MTSPSVLGLGTECPKWISRWWLAALSIAMFVAATAEQRAEALQLHPEEILKKADAFLGPFPSGQKSIVGVIAKPTERKFVNLSKILDHLKSGEVRFTESVGVIDPPPNDTVLGRALRSKIVSCAVDEATLHHRMKETRRNIGCWRNFRHFGDVQYSEVVVYNIHSGHRTNNTIIGRGASEISNLNEYRPVLSVSTPCFGPAKFCSFNKYISPELALVRPTRISELLAADNHQTNRRYGEDSGQNGEWVLASLADNPGYVTLISFVIGIFSCAIGVALYLDSQSGLLSSLSIALIGIGLLTQFFPWWVYLLV